MKVSFTEKQFSYFEEGIIYFSTPVLSISCQIYQEESIVLSRKFYLFRSKYCN